MKKPAYLISCLLVSALTLSANANASDSNAKEVQKVQSVPSALKIIPSKDYQVMNTMEMEKIEGEWMVNLFWGAVMLCGAGDCPKK